MQIAIYSKNSVRRIRQTARPVGERVHCHVRQTVFPSLGFGNKELGAIASQKRALRGHALPMFYAFLVGGLARFDDRGQRVTL